MIKIFTFKSKKFVSHFGKHICTISIFILLSVCVSAQIRLEGRVFDKASQESIPGASVIELGTTNGTITDINGYFSFRVLSLPVTLSVSFLGYTKQEIVVRENKEDITVALEEEVNTLNEVVVVGYGTQRRREVTGSVVSVSKAVLKYPDMSLDRMLGGAVVGVQVTQESGQPGAGSSIRIRGGNSVSASNDPLYVIDGFIFYNNSSSSKTGLGNIESSINPLAAINPGGIAT